MTIAKLTLAPFNAPRQCTCEVTLQEDGTIVEPDFSQCAFVLEAHKEALDRARERLENHYMQICKTTPARS